MHESMNDDFFKYHFFSQEDKFLKTKTPTTSLLNISVTLGGSDAETSTSFKNPYPKPMKPGG